MTNLEKLSLLIKWSRIAALGNNPYAKLSIVAPIVAPLALYTENVARFFNSNFSLDFHSSGMPWLYFSLLSLSAAQFCFNGWAPSEIKEFRSRADYAASGGADLRRMDWEAKAIDLINKKIEEDSPLLSAIDAVNIDQLDFADYGRNERCRAFSESLKSIRKVKHNQGDILREFLKNAPLEIDENGFKNKDRNALLNTLDLARDAIGGRTSFNVDNDLKELRARWHDAQNQSKPIRRFIIVILYSFGLSFFLWNVPKNIIANIISLWPWG